MVHSKEVFIDHYILKINLSERTIIRCYLYIRVRQIQILNIKF